MACLLIKVKVVPDDGVNLWKKLCVSMERARGRQHTHTANHKPSRVMLVLKKKCGKLQVKEEVKEVKDMQTKLVKHLKKRRLYENLNVDKQARYYS